MNNKIALTTFCVILSCHSFFAQELENIDLKRMEIEGKVTSLRESKHKPLEEGDAWESNPYRSEIISFNMKGYIDEIERLESGELAGKMDYTYKKNQLIGITGYTPDGSVFGNLIVQNYDKMGNVIESYREMIDGEEKTIRDRKTWEYDKKGRKIKHTRYREGDPLIIYQYEHDQEGNMTKEIAMLPDGTIDSETVNVYEAGNHIEQNGYFNGKLNYKWLYKYDEKGNRIEFGHTGADGVVYKKTVYTYDENGNKIQELEYRDGVGGTKTTFEYDDHRNLIREVQLTGSGEVIQTISYDYTYDDTGNWVKKIRLLDGEGMQKIERSYEYD